MKEVKILFEHNPNTIIGKLLVSPELEAYLLEDNIAIACGWEYGVGDSDSILEVSLHRKVVRQD